ncbi:MAG: hypothetical protein PWP14_625 [Methanolobus sp.]|nr:hypothetical protein [Methanolobus sp.]
MKQAPIIFVIILISMVVVSAFIGPGSDITSPERRGEGPFSSSERPPGERRLDDFPDRFFIQDTQMTSDRAMLEDIIGKSEQISRRLAVSIIILKQEGEDVEEMESLLDEYTLLVSDARMYLEMSDISAGSDPVDSSLNDSQVNSLICQSEEECLAKSRESITQANLRLKNIFGKLSPYLAPHAVIPENGSLHAQGNGTIVLFGDLDVSLSVSRGRISYTDFNSDLTVRLENGPTPSVSSTEAGQEVVSYTNITGNFSLSGSGFMVEIVGEDISLLATGKGRSELFGNGIYYLKEGNVPGKKQIWKPPLFENN